MCAKTQKQLQLVEVAIEGVMGLIALGKSHMAADLAILAEVIQAGEVLNRKAMIY